MKLIVPKRSARIGSMAREFFKALRSLRSGVSSMLRSGQQAATEA
jgi:hypothetical protein